jgi:predicted TIM-barrel fold metal-dependent hydrolase
VGGLLRRRRAIRAAGSLLEVLNGVPLVDHHAHGILRRPPATLDEFRGRFSESADPRQWPHVATSLSYRRAIAELAGFLECEPREEDVFAAIARADPAEHAARLLRATGTEWLLVDVGYPPAADSRDWRELGGLAACEARPIARLEVGGERPGGCVALKTIAAYRGGLDRVAPEVVSALEANDAAAAPLPVQVHTGFGDADLHLWRSDPSYLKPLVERFAATPFVLLHCYPFVREAGWMASVYANVFLDLSLTIPFVARPAEALREALELAPVSKLLYASDAARTPELFFLAAKRWREALAEVLAESLRPDEAEQAGRAILRDNALGLYGLEQREARAGARASSP